MNLTATAIRDVAGFADPKRIAILGASVAVVSGEYEGPCKCGYSVNSTSDPQYAIFMEALETDFTHIYDLKDNPCWIPQTTNVSASAFLGSLGKMTTPDSAVPNPFKSDDQWSGATVKNDGSTPGLQLWVNSTRVDGLVPTAEIVAKDSDMIYGSFRVGMKITNVPGTCSAFFWYQSNSEEIDMEFLSSSFNDSSRPIYLVMATPESISEVYDTGTYKVHQLPFAPSDGLHEYRFDWTPDGVSFYADGTWLTDMRWTHPDRPGRLSLNHWSNGNSLWSGGPPTQDAVTTVVYVKAYYNTSDATKQSQYARRCPDGAANSICQIQDQPFPPGLGNNNANLFFGGGRLCGEGIKSAANPSATVIDTTELPISATQLLASATEISTGTTQHQTGMKSVAGPHHSGLAVPETTNAAPPSSPWTLRSIDLVLRCISTVLDWTDLVGLLVPLV